MTAAPTKPTDAFDEVFGDKQRALVVMAHPDDNEIICGGLVARLVKSGKSVRLVVTTNGDKGMGARQIGPGEFGRRRVAEQLAAAQILGLPADQIFNLGIPDGECEADLATIERIVWHIRQFRPDILITHCPDEVINTFSTVEGTRWVNHRDHRHTAQATTDALYPYSRDRGFWPQQLVKGLEPHAVSAILYADAYENPLRRDFDITDYIDIKRRALAACPSVIPADHIDCYIDETKVGKRYYEPLRYLKGL